MFRIIIVAILWIYCPFAGISQEKQQLKGQIKDIETGQPLSGAHILISGHSGGKVTGIDGDFRLRLSQGRYRLIISFMGYKTDTSSFLLKGDTSLTIGLKSTSIQGEKIVFVGNKDRNIQSATPGMVTLSSREIDEIPTLLGEQDPIKYLKLTPGIQSAEGSNRGIFVRGGGADQNLILLDQTPLYNPSHLGGLFSVFLPGTIRDLEVIKGALPAQYGGRLSSVISINTKKGDPRQMNYQGNIGMLSSSFYADGPLKKDTTSFFIGARRTYFDLLIKPFSKLLDNSSALHSASFYHFFDSYMKINHRMSSKDQLIFSGYLGRDSYDFSREYIDLNTNMLWGNSAASIRWNHIWNNRFFMNTSLHYTGYMFDFNANQSIYDFSMHTLINDWIYQLDFTYLPGEEDIKFKFGLEHIYHHFDPNKQKVSADKLKMDIANITGLYSHETAAYVQADVDLTEALRINAGLRYTRFIHTGPYDQLKKNEFGNIADTIHYRRFSAIGSGYNHLEPRLSLRYLLSSSTSVKLAYNRGVQYVHIVPVTSVSLPTDIWIPSTHQIPPQTGQQFSGGLFKNFMDDQWETSFSAFYKSMSHQLKFARGLVNPQSMSLDERLKKGHAHAYGVEFFVKKHTGPYSGWLSYTWSKTIKQFDALNNGDPFFAKYDRRHDLSLTAAYKLNEKWSVSGVFSYASGSRMTIPVARYLIQRSIVNEYGAINGYQMPAYHHLDLSATYRVDKKDWISEWNFSVYNIYNRANPYYIYFEAEEDVQNYKLDVQPKLVSLFPVLPSVSWTFKF